MTFEYEVSKLDAIALSYNSINLIHNNNQMIIELTESPSTGYCWYYTISDPSILTLENKKKFDFNKSNIIGGSLQIIWRFKCLKCGECKIHFAYYNSWKSDSRFLDEYSYIVKIE
ncbi:protease inhibitor I42 family protein [Clostridium lacusfryxellense]|uniref:protease inhibitor I42 family protein n=1 Tax=Clostridium lacusfryxellense TaxID=205328 RepID=UPI001C0C4ECD|nr:protease inhibitor I42 family protein [Clostridium lacusfryxellense]MBU3110563.1 protease inhibitor I42 family protein [Clostridium lacusfryxellense]